VKRGAKGLIGLRRQFKLMDSDGSGDLDFGEFRKALDDYRVGCTGPEADQIFAIFDHNRNGVVNFEEFMAIILGELSPYRQNIIMQAFSALDRDGDGFLDFEEVKARFDPTRHPEVITGHRTVEDCRFEFLDMFSTHHNV
jgi:Ca2+-binding EF-hand superfamily protein